MDLAEMEERGRLPESRGPGPLELYDRVSGQPLGFGFVEIADDAEAEWAIASVMSKIYSASIWSSTKPGRTKRDGHGCSGGRGHDRSAGDRYKLDCQDTPFGGLDAFTSCDGGCGTGSVQQYWLKAESATRQAGCWNRVAGSLDAVADFRR